MQELCGWVKNQAEVERIWAMMPTPFFATPEPEDRDQHNHLILKDMIGDYGPKGPQEIGDCVSWGNGRAVDYTEVLEAYVQMQEKKAKGEPTDRYIYEEMCTEVIYALSRVQVGGGSIRGDGSVGAWAAKAITDFGTISRPELDRIGVGGTYSGSRARSWGRSGLPKELLPAAIKHVAEDATPVRNFKEFAWHAQNLRVTAVCSDVGFENGSNNYTARDADGFATRRGSWGHCMTLVSVRMGKRPGGLLCNQWPPEMVYGPMGPVEIPPCSWWVDADTIDEMLGQGDSFTFSGYKGYPARKLTWSW